MRCLVVACIGACGPSQVECAHAIAPGDLVITEVLAHPVGDAPAWLEMFNATEHALEVEGLAIQHGTSTRSLAAATIAARSYFVVGSAEAPYVDAVANLGDLTGKLVLACSAQVIDAASPGAITAGHARELGAGAPPDAMLDDDPEAWCEANATEVTPGNFGTPGEPNDCVPLASGTCNDGSASREIRPPREGELVITEAMPSPTRAPDATGEWIEAVALAEVDLNGVEVERAGHAPDVIASPQCLHVAPGDRIVLARARDGNGGLPPPTALFGFALVVPGDVQLAAAGEVIDAITWQRAAVGKALQLDPQLTDAQSNDAPASFCDATTPYGDGDDGTPGAPNVACPLVPPPGSCIDGGTARPIHKPGVLAITEVMPNPRVEPAQEWFEIQNTGSAAFDLNELGLDRAGDSRPPEVIHAAMCLTITPGAFAVFARSADPAVNGGLTEVDATFGFAMINSGGDVRVLDGQTVLAAASWQTSTDGVSAQLAPEACAGATPYGDGSNLGTPRATNACR